MAAVAGTAEDSERPPARKAAGLVRARPRHLVLPALVVLLAAPGVGWSHPGDLDSYGGHFDGKTGYYHYHRPAMDMALRKKAYLEWLAYPHKGVIKGTVAKIERPNAIWVRVPYRPAYQELVTLVSPSNRDDRQQLLRVWLRFVSPEETGLRNRAFARWFKERVVFELRQKLAERQVTVQFELLGEDARRMRGMVFLGEENINLWLVLNGWSYYVINEGENSFDTLFRQAEDLARGDRAGVWNESR